MIIILIWVAQYAITCGGMPMALFLPFGRDDTNNVRSRFRLPL